ncbi:MAG: fatty acid desaturase [Myxococcota bacterium]|nr:fatty acid desaturase [Myxococcota bacterium]
MKKATWMRKAASAGNEFHWRKQDVQEHNRRNLLWTAALWGSVPVVLGIGTLLRAFAPVLMPVWMVLAGLYIGCVILGHFVLIIHECSHNMYLLDEDRDKQGELNRRIGKFASAMVFTEYIKHWEEGHAIHHTRPCEDVDPQDRDPITGRELYTKFAKIWLIPFYFMSQNPSGKYEGGAARLAKGALFLGPLALLAFLMAGFWGVGALYIGYCFTSTLNYTKKAQEHGGGLKFEPFPILRSRTYLYPLQFFTSPFKINYHFEHHANANVPWYLLPAYHEKIKEIVPQELHPYYFHGEFWKQMAGEKPLPPDELRHLFAKSTAA